MIGSEGGPKLSDGQGCAVFIAIVLAIFVAGLIGIEWPLGSLTDPYLR